ncbi:MAG: cytochrome c oxidase subunit 3 [Planctomycetes bacterium]|nr:cytochrome c oxidase subunit 3 [Planctomycetota bacterium]
MRDSRDAPDPIPPVEPREVWPPYAKGQSLPGAGVLGMWFFLASLTMPFLAVFVGYLVFRATYQPWPPAGAPPLPALLWVCTGLILCASIAVHWGLVSVRAERQARVRAATLAALVLGAAFFACQCGVWHEVWRGWEGVLAAHPAAAPGEQPAVPAALRIFVVTLFLFTSLHAIHVIGGLVLQTVVTIRAFRGVYRYYHHPGITYSAMYWHFLDAAWLLVFLALVLGSR